MDPPDSPPPLFLASPAPSKLSRLVATLHSFYVSFLCLCLVAASTAQAVGFKRLGYALGAYPYFILLVISLCFVPIFFSVVGFIVLRTGGFMPETTTWRFTLRFLTVGMFNALNGVCAVFANPHVPGTIQQIVVQMVVPFAMVMSLLFLGTRYTPTQMIGALVIFCGMAVKVGPTFGGGVHGSGHETSMFWTGIFLLAQVPMAAQSVYQEYAFSQARVNVVHMMAWASLGQFLVLCACAPLNLIPHFGNITPSTFPSYFHDAYLCVTNHMEGHPECTESLPLLVVCVAAMLLCNVVQASLVKAASASLVVLILTVVTPVSTIAFTLPFLMGSHTEALSPATWVALLVLTAGIVIFRLDEFGDFWKRTAEPIEMGEDEPLLDVDVGGDKHTLQRRNTVDPHGPRILAARVGIISSEYTHGDQMPDVNLLFENTRPNSRPRAPSAHF